MELALRSNEQSQFTYNFSNCLIKFNDFTNQFADNPLYDFEDNTKYSTILLNLDSDFFFPGRNDFRIGLESAAVNSAALEFAQEIPLDILGTVRTPNPDLGSYQAIEKE